MNITPLEALKDLTKLLNTNDYLSLYSMCDLHIIEKALKEYQEIREIAKRYNWDDITSEIFNVKTDKKYRDLFNNAIVSIQEDYRKARALEIIKEKNVDVIYLRYECNCLEDYNENNQTCDLDKNEYLTKQEYDLLKEVLL